MFKYSKKWAFGLFEVLGGDLKEWEDSDFETYQYLVLKIHLYIVK